MSVDKPQQGEPLKISARRLGQAYEAGEDFARRRRLGASQLPVQRPWNQCIVQVKNESGADRIAGDALEIGASLLTTIDDRHLWFSAAKRSGNGVCGVLTEPIKSNDIGPMCVAGVVLAYVYINDADNTHARVATSDATLQGDFGGPFRIVQKPSGTGSKWCAVLLGDAIYRRKGKTTASVSAGSSGACDVYIGGSAVGSVTAYLNWMENGISAIGSGVEVEIEWFDDERKWVIVAAECE